MDAIAMLVFKLERYFLHIHPASQKIFYELLNMHDPKIKKNTTMIFMREFVYIVREARDIFDFYRITLRTLQ